ncbi:hypothetical protein BX616_006310 [Lobosporangium transversale]|uniref:DUF7082 domain-containing protein n=1 Tax=Lobosporangium transversale TaxID=64571 RepID=A0A1Y2G7D3_9FUNG|nr:hypothetical protein BCR41DRAFT_375344 [Lobosporangium transversale]KAF9897033.1 hypothetical protein BX616_006310 [Lobosporangium transversale]ORY99778.1 hypothetical protein BCR41DRAFT_375344 [Lobosporangium transversale]|eukprot:XP_021876012.1 hypothetical protein BCR41DRAFT_375344 [Lobosporangium transversale]
MPVPQPHMHQMTAFKAPLQIQAPRVLEFTPQFGNEGSTFTVTLQSSPDRSLRIGFGTLVVDTKQYAANGYVTLSCTVPNFSITKWFSNKVPLYVLQMENDMVLESWPFGDFTYYDDPQSKRLSTDRSIYAQTLNQSPVANKKHIIDIDMSSPLSSATTSPLTSLPRHDYSTATNNTMTTMTPAAYSRPGYYNTNQMMTSQMPSYSQADLTATSTYAMTTATNSTGYIHPSQPMTTPYPSASINSALPISSYSPPYSSLLNKANLKFNGNLEDMAINWSGEEWESHRRLVQFWRRQDNSDIYCNFAPVAPSQRQPNSIVVSCIYWAEKNDCFLTSVDCIYLLESLIGVRFTVEEKNRIRRNLEGFRPITVSKCKPESAEFFKLIMSFPNPKPRNIEKDVKVFPWKVLSYALKKIISKYTASYSSTASIQNEAFHNINFPHGSTLPLTAQQQSLLESSMSV